MKFSSISIVSLIALVFVTCRDSQKRSETPPARTKAVIHDHLDSVVEFSGCQRVLAGPVCVLSGTKPLTFWIKTDPAAKMTFTASESDIAPKVSPPVTLQGGNRYQLDVPKGVHRLVVSAQLGAKVSDFTLRLQPSSDPPIFDSVAALRREGKIEEALTSLTRALPSLQGPNRAQGLSQLARIRLQQNQIESAVETFYQSLALHRKNGFISDASSDAAVLAYTLIYNGRRFSEARQAMETVERAPVGDARSEIRKNWIYALLAMQIGDLRSAQSYTAMTALQAKRHDIQWMIEIAQEIEAVVLQQLGRFGEASSIYETMWQASAKASSCRKAWILNERGWARLLSLEAGDADVSDPIPLLEQAVSLYTRDCGSKPQEIVNSYLSLILALLHKGQAKRAALLLRKAEEYKEGWVTRYALWKIDVEARIALQTNRSRRALTRFGELLRLARNHLHFQTEWRAIIGQAEALTQLGKNEAALETYHQAEKLLAHAILNIPLEEGRAAFLAQRQRAIQSHVRLLLQLGRNKEALDVVRRNRSQALQSLVHTRRLAGLSASETRLWEEAMAHYWHERDKMRAEVADEWRHPTDHLGSIQQKREQQRLEIRQILDKAFSRLLTVDSTPCENPHLRQPDSDETLLAYFQGGEQWIGFAADRQGVMVVPLEVVSPTENPESLSDHLLWPLQKKIETSRKLCVLPQGNLESVDFHALPWKGAPVLASKQVVYGVDLMRCPRPLERSEKKPTHATIVVDPDGDLFSAQQEGREVEHRIHELNPNSEIVYLARDSATHSAVRSALEKTDLFHFSGHAAFQGQEGWDSALLLTREDAFSVFDILALTRVPPIVVLHACETSQSNISPVATVNLARAFILSGSEQVIASKRPLQDALARPFADLLYKFYQTESFVESFRRAQLEIIKRRTDLDWSSLRLLVR